MFCNDQSKIRNLHMEWEQVRLVKQCENFNIFLSVGFYVKLIWLLSDLVKLGPHMTRHLRGA